MRHSRYGSPSRSHSYDYDYSAHRPKAKKAKKKAKRKAAAKRHTYKKRGWDRRPSCMGMTKRRSRSE